MLQILDKNWMEQLDAMESLEEGVRLRGYAQTNPLQAYALEGFEIFDNMIASTNAEISLYLLKAEVRQNLEPQPKQKRQNLQTNDNDEGTKHTPKRVNKIGRNEPCPCGSGKKFKKCCGQ